MSTCQFGASALGFEEALPRISFVLCYLWGMREAYLYVTRLRCKAEHH
jgi:hypothetical protein